MIPLVVLYGWGVIVNWIKLVLIVYAAIISSIGGTQRKHLGE